jgi:hypothetical protein
MSDLDERIKAKVTLSGTGGEDEFAPGWSEP